MPLIDESIKARSRQYVHPEGIVSSIGRNDLSGSKVLFVNMPLRESAVPNCAPNGIALLAARLLCYNVRVSILDLNAYRIKDQLAYFKGFANGRVLTELEAEQKLKDQVKKFGEPDVVAISGMITTLRWQQVVARIARKLLPNSFIVSGNGLSTEFKEGLFNWIPELDAVAHSEGDLSVLKVVHDAACIKKTGSKSAFLSGKLDPYCLGMVGDKPKFLYDGGRPSNLDDAPFPAFDLLDDDVLNIYLNNEIWGLKANNSSATPFTMKRSINTVSSRGCPYACKFCFRGATGERNYGIRSAENVLLELRTYHQKYGVDFVGITDDNFMVNRARINDMAKIFPDFIESTGIRWGTHGRLDEAADLRPDKGFNRPLRVDQMFKAGCVYIGFGAESADEKTLSAMGKGGFILSNGIEEIDGWRFPRTMIEGVKNTLRSGIHANCTWIMGYPGETLDQLKTTVAFMLWQEKFYTENGLSKDSVNKTMFVATAYPGTEMFKHPTVRRKLSETFGISFDSSGDPVCDDALLAYVLELDDATKVIQDGDGDVLNFGEMTDDKFMKAHEYAERGQTEKILEMN